MPDRQMVEMARRFGEADGARFPAVEVFLFGQWRHAQVVAVIEHGARFRVVVTDGSCSREMTYENPERYPRGATYLRMSQTASSTPDEQAGVDRG